MSRKMLTQDQRREVKSLMEDSGYTRTEAVAWVLAFGADTYAGVRAFEDPATALKAGAK